MMTCAVTAGSAELRAIVRALLGSAKLIVQTGPQTLLFASRIAWRSVFAPLSALLVTVSVANCETMFTLVALLLFAAPLSFDAVTVAVIDDVLGDAAAVIVRSTLPESLVERRGAAVHGRRGVRTG